MIVVDFPLFNIEEIVTAEEVLNQSLAAVGWRASDGREIYFHLHPESY